MAETIMGASGQNLWQITTGGAGLITGSVEISNATINVDVTVGDYVSVIGSPAYNLPIIGSVEISTIRTMPTTTVTATNLDIRDLAPIQDYVSVVGSPNYNLPVSISSLLGSVEVSSIRNALPAGTALLGSIIASPVGTQTIIGSVEISNATLNVDVTVSDYISMIGSPNYSLPIIGSIEISTIRTMPTTTVTATDLDIRNLVSATDSVSAIGSVQVSSVVGALPAGTNIIGSIAADIQKFGVSLPVGTNVIGNIGSIGAGILGSVQISSISSYSAWTGIGSIVSNDSVRDGSAITFDWVGALTGSVMAIPATGSRFNVTDVFCSASGQGIVTLFFNVDNTSNRIAKGTLANFGGFVSNYSKPLPGPINGSLMITTAATGFTPVGTATITIFQSA